MCGSRIPCLRAQAWEAGQRAHWRVDCLSPSLLQASVFWSISYYSSPFAFFYLYRKGQCAYSQRRRGGSGQVAGRTSSSARSLFPLSQWFSTFLTP